MSALFQSKALLAKLLAKENLTIEERNVDTAHFDLERRILCIPILKSNLFSFEYDLFIGHEVGHALFTPPELWINSIRTKKIPKSVVNVIEDARIERKIKSRYPGLRNSFVKAYKKLLSENFFGTDGKDLTKLNFIDRANLHFKAGSAFGIVFKNDEEKKFIEEIDQTDTFDDVIELSERIVKYLRDEVKDFEVEVPKPVVVKVKIPKDSIETLDDVDQLLEELTQAFEEDNSSPDDNDDTKSEPKKSDEISEDDPSGTNVDENNGEDTTETKKVSDLPSEQQEDMIDELIESSTDNLYNENSNKLFDKKSLTPTNVTLPEPNINNIVHSYKDVLRCLDINPFLSDQAAKDRILKNYYEYSKSINKVVSYMVKEFELRKNADMQKRAKVSKTGEIDTNRIHSYRFSDDIFKRMTTMPDGKSHGLVMFIDWSGSMGDMIQNTIRQLISMVLFCKKVNIPFEVYAIAESFNSCKSSHQYSTKPKSLIMGKLALVNIFSSKMKAAEFTYMAAAFSSSGIRRYSKHFMPMLGTPLNESIIAAMKIVPKFKEDNQLQIVNTVFLSDGCSNGNWTYTDPRADSGSYQNFTGDVVINDPVSRFSEKVVCRDIHNHTHKTVAMTKGLLRLLKYRTNSNVLGFFVTETRNFNSTVPYFENANKMFDAKEVFLQEKSVIVENAGYDEFYIIKNEFQEIEDFGDVEVPGTTVRSVLSAFKKHNKNRLQSRTMLNRFIQMIA